MWHGACPRPITDRVRSPQSGAVFYFFLSWVPAYLRSPAVGVPERETLIPILLGMVLFGAAIPLSGRMICDRRIPKLWSLLVIYVALAAGCPPAILWATSGSVVAFWVVVLLAFTVAGVSGAVFASVCVHIYPSGVRITGYNLSHNLAMVVAGGERRRSVQLRISYESVAYGLKGCGLLHPIAGHTH